MNNTTKESFEATISALLKANPNNSNKGKEMKEWFKQSFSVKATVSNVKEDKQIGNRITEQFKHKASIVVFVCNESVNKDNLISRAIVQRYPALNTFLVVVAMEDGSFIYDKIFSKTQDGFTNWAVLNLGVTMEPLINNFDTKIGENVSLQQIFYGAPGTGKSYKTNEVAKKYSTIRTTFHPDSDYSTFVGAYKPTTIKSKSYGLNSIGETKPIVDPETGKAKEESKIEYRFVKQAFLKAYVQAWKFFCEAESVEDIEPQFLVIEEINRGNCAQIFGDLFQLLDRKDGFSEYPIEADEDISKSLTIEDSDKDPSFGEMGLQFTDSQKETINAIFNKDEDAPYRDVASEIAIGKVLVLPPNLYIWATMNTSDQSLFPIDSAFKRRWDWKYVRICEGKKKDGISPLNYRIKFMVPAKGEKPAEPVDESWWRFVKAINKQIEDATKSEDKKLGYFFCKPDKKEDGEEENTIISAETFVSKVVFYLWQDVFKDYGNRNNIFKSEDISFHDFYPEDMVANKDTNPEGIDLALVKRFIEKVLDSNKEQPKTAAEE
jgi:hypothetical protein